MAGVSVFDLNELGDGKVSLFKASIWLVSLGIINGVHGNKGNRALIPLASIRRYLNGEQVRLDPIVASAISQPKVSTFLLGKWLKLRRLTYIILESLYNIDYIERDGHGRFIITRWSPLWGIASTGNVNELYKAILIAITS